MSIFRRAAERRGTPAELLVVALGNPGADYVGTRHNIGVEVIDALADRHGGRFNLARRERARTAEIRVGGHLVALAFPQTYMNLSGESVAPLVKRYGIDDPAKIIVVQDEMDLPVGRLKLKAGGGTAGHNGLKSISAHLGTDDYARIRIGVGKPGHARAGKDHVLKRPGAADRAELDIVVQEAADAVELYLTDGLDAAMNRFNAARG